MCAMPRMNIMTSYFKISLPQKMFEKICRVICLGLTLEFAVASAGPHRKEHNSANVCVVSHDTLIPTDCTSCTGKRIHLQDFDVFLLWQYFGLRWYACLHDSFGGLHGVAVAFRACCREVLQAISAPLWGFWCVYPKIRFRAIRTALLQRCTAIPLQSQSIAMSAGVLIHFLKKHKTNQNCLNNAFSSQNTILQMDTLNSDSTLQLRSCRTVWKSDKHVHGGGAGRHKNCSIVLLRPWLKGHRGSSQEAAAGSSGLSLASCEQWPFDFLRIAFCWCYSMLLDII